MACWEISQFKLFTTISFLS